MARQAPTSTTCADSGRLAQAKTPGKRPNRSFPDLFIYLLLVLGVYWGGVLSPELLTGRVKQLAGQFNGCVTGPGVDQPGPGAG